MYAGKLMVAAATVVVSGSLWLVPATVYIFVATIRAMYHEDRALEVSLREYRDYQGRTTRLVPWIF